MKEKTSSHIYDPPNKMEQRRYCCIPFPIVYDYDPRSVALKTESEAKEQKETKQNEM